MRQQEAKSLTEEEITGSLIRALKGNERTVCFVSGSGEHSLTDTGREGYGQAKEALERNNYKTRTISLLEKPEVPQDCTVVVVAGPKFEYVDPVVNALKTYVEKGGRALFMMNPPLSAGQERAPENTTLVKMLEGWGVTLNRDLALDMSGIGQIFGFNEAVPLVTQYESHPIVRELGGAATAFPLARTVDGKSTDKTTVEKLFSTSENSFATTNLGSAIKLDPTADKKGPLTLGVAGTYNTGQQNQQGRFVVVGSSGWIASGIFRFNGNRDLFLNIMNWLSSDEDLISIRPKDPENRPLSLNRSQMQLVMYTSLIFLPLLAVIGGVAVWWRRR
jgi:ABC-type uncharacterized transport system involved in gliding motility auxiliary subunit